MAPSLRSYSELALGKQETEDRSMKPRYSASEVAELLRQRRILLRYLDRLSDPTPEDSLEKIVGELTAEVMAMTNKQGKDI
jgi:hypothetical protein